MMARSSAHIMIMAGGTGGHVFPALEVARVFQSHGARVSWLGSPRGIEQRLVPAAGLPLFTMSIEGVRGRGTLCVWKSPGLITLVIWRSLGAHGLSRRVLMI